MNRQPTTSHSYFVALIDYGPNYIGKVGPSGFEALPVNPETTRRQIVDEVADVLASDNRTLVHVKHINGNDLEDVTAEILAEASAIKADYDSETNAIDAINNRILAERDRRRALEMV